MTTMPVATTSFTIDRCDRSPVEFEGVLLVESDGIQDSSPQGVEARYRVRVYQEAHRQFVLEIAIVAGDTILFQTADFAESVAVIDELLCLLHQDAMDGLPENTSFEVENKRVLSQRLEADLDHQSVFVLQRLAELVTS